MNVEDLIQKCLTSSISERELGQLKTALDAQPEYREVLAIEHAMYQYRNENLKVQLRSAIPTAKSGVSRTKKRVMALIRLIALALIGYGLWGYMQSTAKGSVSHMAGMYLQDKSISPAKLMGNTAPDVDVWSLAVDKYSAEAYTEALQLIQTLEDPTVEQKLYEGLCHVYADSPDYEKAGAIMLSLQQTEEIIVYDQALWYGALIDIKRGRLAAAESQLSTIVDKNLWKVQEGAQLLQMLEEKK